MIILAAVVAAAAEPIECTGSVDGHAVAYVQTAYVGGAAPAKEMVQSGEQWVVDGVERYLDETRYDGSRTRRGDLVFAWDPASTVVVRAAAAGGDRIVDYTTTAKLTAKKALWAGGPLEASVDLACRRVIPSKFRP